MAMKAGSSGNAARVASEKSPDPSSRQRILWRAPQLGLFMFVVALLYLHAHRLDPIGTLNQSVNNTEPNFIGNVVSCASTQYDRCESIVSCETRRFGFNISDGEGAASHWRLFNFSNSTVRNRLSGTILVQQGSASQTSDIEVEFGVRSSSLLDYGSFVFNCSDSGLSMDYLPSDNDVDVCTQAQLSVYLRPESPLRLLDVLEIRSEMITIWVWDLAWQINHLITHTSCGMNFYSAGKEAPEVRPRKVSASTTTGAIGGAYVCDGTVEICSDSGPVNLLLVPRYTTGKAIQPELISVSTTSGNANVATLWPYWTEQPFTHRLDIHTVSGNISADIPHRSSTNLSSISGDIYAHLRPFAARNPDDARAIYTSTQYGHTVFHLDNANREPLDELYDPLLSTTSGHYVGNGTMELRYPFSWFGSMDATVGDGSIKFEASALDEVKRGDGLSRRLEEGVRGVGWKRVLKRG